MISHLVVAFVVGIMIGVKFIGNVYCSIIDLGGKRRILL